MPPKKSTTVSSATADENFVQAMSQDGAVSSPPEAASTPSGERAPDGTHTSEGSTTAAQNPAAVVFSTETATDGTPTSSAVEPAGEPFSATTPEATASASGTMVAENARPLTHLLEMTGCRDAADLIDMANVGRSLMDTIAYHTSIDGPLKGWHPADGPAEVVSELFELALVLQDKLNPASAVEEAPAATLPPAWLSSTSPHDYPLTALAFEGWAELRLPIVRVASKFEGMWRGGICHSQAPQDHVLSVLTPEQIEEMLADPAISVELV